MKEIQLEVKRKEFKLKRRTECLSKQEKIEMKRAEKAKNKEERLLKNKLLEEEKLKK